MSILNCFSTSRDDATSVIPASVTSVGSNCLTKLLLLFNNSNVFVFCFFALRNLCSYTSGHTSGSLAGRPFLCCSLVFIINLQDWSTHFLLHLQLNGSWLIMKWGRLAVNVLNWRFARWMRGICVLNSQWSHLNARLLDPSFSPTASTPKRSFTRCPSHSPGAGSSCCGWTRLTAVVWKANCPRTYCTER